MRNMDPIAEFREDHRKVRDGIHEMLQIGKRFGRLRIYACSASMAILNISRDELIDEVDASMGMVGFMNLVKDADLTLYI